jgi:hypothetical protein
MPKYTRRQPVMTRVDVGRIEQVSDYHLGAGGPE